MAHWKSAPLYQALVTFLPAYVTKTERTGVEPDLTIDVHALRAALDPVRSHENVYQWLRKGTLLPRNAKALCKVANAENNVAALKKNGRKPPVLDDFTEFYAFD
ncbi:hypothetical protein [Sphingomonas sp. TREG-RG-20F-R18-01]|uniref:hypothetical protein n=1 Tax=Sphingomonas sp. TREG-RG-20F-R18-01 TaxID=2914982 RepID=UPI001F579D0C|nr:hypothetical protein [Sphingomonas sp. TREG-RG-20F-R18-01]